MACLSLELIGPWVVLGFCVVWRLLMSSYLLMFPGVRFSLMSQDLDLSLLPLVFSLILTVASRFLHLYSPDDKTSRLRMKSFSTVRDTRRGTQSYVEKRRGRREIEVTRRRRGGIKRAESKLASNHFPMCSPQSGSLRDVHRVRGDKSEEGDRGCQEDKRQNQK